MKFIIPETMEEEHRDLQDLLKAMVADGGEMGHAAQAVEHTLLPHLLKEEEYVLPPLGLLATLVERPAQPEMEEVLPLTDRLRTALPQMLEEHKRVNEALDRLTKVAWKEDTPQYLSFAAKLKRHIKHEEEVLYPAALLVGQYLKLVLKK